MKGIIMAGGEGTRLRPLTCSLPKPMVPIVNKPVMEHIINLLKKHNITDIGVTTYYLPNVISDYFGGGEKYGVNLNYYIEETPLGTGGSVLNADEYLTDTFIVISGDAMTDINIKSAVDFHKSKNSKATLILKREAVPLEYGIVITDNSGRIVRFLEKPSWGEVFSDTINTGIYILEPEVFNYYKKGDNFDFSKDLFPKLLKDGIPMYGYITEDYWCDIGDLISYKQTHFDILDGKVRVDINYKEIRPGVWCDTNFQLPEGVVINPPAYIGNNCKIGKGVIIDSYSVVGDSCEIDENTSLKRSVIWDKAHIGKNVQCRGTTVCNKVTLKNNVNLFEDSVIGSESSLFTGVVVNPSVKIWPYKYIKDDTIVSRNLVWGTKASRTLFGNKDIIGDINVDITPEFSSLLGSTFATVMKNDGSILISSDGDSPSMLIRESIISGVLSTGAKIISLDNVICPVSRFGVRFYKAAGGIHISTDKYDNNKIHIEFYNKNGGNIDRKLEKKIEHLFFRGDFERCNADMIMDVMKVDNFSSFYIHSNLNIINHISQISKNHIRVLISSPSADVSLLASVYLEQIGCNVKTDYSMNNFNSFNEYISYFSSSVRTKGYNLGILFNENGENIILIDNAGETISDQKYLVLSSLIALKSGTTKDLIVPFTATRTIEKIAEKHGVEVIRTKSSASDIMNEMLDTKKHNDTSLIQYILNFDGILASGKIIDFLIEKSMSLNEFSKEIPEFHIKKDEIPCDFSSKGTIIRQLIENSKNDDIELFEGIKINSDKGWTIILPDSEKPKLNIYTEGFSEEYADELTANINSTIQNLLNSSDKKPL